MDDKHPGNDTVLCNDDEEGWERGYRDNRIMIIEHRKWYVMRLQKKQAEGANRGWRSLIF